MVRKALILSVILALAAIAARAQDNTYSKADTLVFRRDSMDTRRGVLRSIPDSVFFHYNLDAVFAARVNPDEVFSFGRIDVADTPVPLMEYRKDPVGRLAAARRFRLAYRFDDALGAAMQALEWADDPRLRAQAESEYFLAQNGLGMTDNCTVPTVIAKRRFSLKEFYLYYPLTDRSFRSAPNPFDQGTDSPVPTYVPKSSKKVFFSSPDSGGSRNIYVSENRDSLWTAPVLLGESLVSAGNEITPFLSADGKTLYFASDGLFGMGGYDLYKSRWNEATSTWGDPENLGFPFSSPADDFMLIETPDRKYTIFASNRECSRDSVFIYVLKYAETPVKRTVTAAGDLLVLSQLNPESAPEQIDNASLSSFSGNQNSGALYMEMFAKADELSDYILKLNGEMGALKKAYDEAEEGDGKEKLAALIASKEEEISSLTEDLKSLNAEIKELEVTLSSTSALNTGRVADAAETEVVGAGEGYVFSKRRMGLSFKAKVTQWQANPKTVFKVSPAGKFGDIASLPQGFYYQICFLDTTRHISVDDLRGLNPVFERQTRRLHYLYYTGIFMRYQDALRALNEVRRLGFPDVEIVAYEGAASISVEQALELEAAQILAEQEE